MGRARSYDVIEYRNKIMIKLLENENIVSLMDSTLDTAQDDLYYKFILPHEFIPDTETKTHKYINFDLRADIDTRNRTYKNITLWFFVLCHNDVIRTSRGCWYDRVVCELDNVFGEQNVLGVGKMSLVSNVPYKPNNRFTGRVLTFTVKEFTDGLKNGK